MWPFTPSPARRLERARFFFTKHDYLRAREELEGVDLEDARDLWQVATDMQIQRVLEQIRAELVTGGPRVTEFVGIARGLGATPEQIQGAMRR